MEEARQFPYRLKSVRVSLPTRMKILRVITSVNPKIGGPIEGIKQISWILANKGHITEIACLDSPDSVWLNNFQFKVYALGPGKTNFKYSRKIFKWLKQNIKNYDCVIVHGLWQYPSLAVWKTSKKMKIPYFIYPHGMLDPWFKQNYILKHIKKCVYWPFQYRILRDAKAVFFTSEEEKEHARESFRPYKCNEKVVNYGIIKQREDSKKQKEMFFSKFPELKNKRIILFLGRIHEKKGIDLLLKAFTTAAIKDNLLHLVIAGPNQNDLKEKLKELIEILKINNKVTWTGMLLDEIKWGAFYSAEVFILPSHQENFGIAVVEALSCGVPVLITNKINIWREIAQYEAGLIENDDLDGTIKLLERWLSVPNSQKRLMKKQAVKCFEDNFEISKSTKRLIDIIRQ